MKVLITGVSGFIGSHLARHLVELGHDVSGAYIRDRPILDGVELFEAELLDTAALRGALRLAKPEVIVHLAGLSHVGASWNDMAEYFRVNVLGTESLLDAAKDSVVLVASSAEVYGSVPETEQPIPEERHVAPCSPYGLTKAAMERLALMRGATVVRAFNVVGPGQTEDFALPAFAAQLAGFDRGDGAAVLKVGNLAARRDLLHVRDAVAAYAVLLQRAGKGEVYNVGSGRALAIGEALDRLIAISGVKCRVEVDPGRFRPVDMPLLVADNSRLRSLGWSVAHPLDRALEQLWEAARMHAARPSPNALSK